MTLRMADGPVANLAPGLDAYAGYVDAGGIGVTFPAVVAKFPQARHLSISVHGAPAMCADVENGALSSWAGYTWGYCNASSVAANILAFGRPGRLWVAHYTEVPHICTSTQCWPQSPIAWQADGTQWTDHSGLWDESKLADDFFDDPPPQPPEPVVIRKDTPMMFRRISDGAVIALVGAFRFPVLDPADMTAGTAAGVPIWECSDAQYAAVTKA